MKTRNPFLKPYFLSTTALVLAAGLALQPTAPARAADEAAVDAEAIEAQIERSYQNARSGDFGYVEADYVDGTVYLDGEVYNYLDKRFVERSAAAMRGVDVVVNDVEVRPNGISDAALEESIVDGLNASPLTEPQDIDVAVVDGLATLTGVVDSYVEKIRAGDIAASILGVLDVENELAVESEVEVSDAELETAISERLTWDSWTAPDAIEVNVLDGVATLSGAVATLEERDRAYELAWVEGVEAVEAEDLVIENPQPGVKVTDVKPRNDNNVVNAIEGEWERSPWITAENLTATFEGGTATISGAVGTLFERREAADEAQDVLGVEEVENLIYVSQIMPRPDRELQEAADRILENDPYLHDQAISATAFEGRIYLTGSVEEAFQRRRAENRMEELAGVRDVRNAIGVDNAMMMTDAELAASVRENLKWDARVDAGGVSVSVDNSVVTLTGSVANERAIDAAVEASFEAGAHDVYEMLTVDVSA